MQFKIFAIPATGSPELEEEMNRFLRSHRVVSVQKKLETGEGSLLWCFCAEYVEGSAASGVFPKSIGDKAKRIDYKAVLSEEDFALFARLRDIRKELAGADPVYTVCTNEQLAAMATQRPGSIEELKKIEGIGDKKLKEFGESFLRAIREPGEQSETGGKSD